MPDVGFYKLCGSGTGEGFTPWPNTAVWAILAAWPNSAKARDNLATAPIYLRWRQKAVEHWTILLEPTSARGTWSGVQPFMASDTPHDGPIVALTRASVRPGKFLRFWRRVPNISNIIGSDPNVIFKIGIGEVPLLHQVTFSIWPDAASIAAFARGNTHHGQAIHAVRTENWFSEELYARFRILDSWGTWNGKAPLSRQEAA